MAIAIPIATLNIAITVGHVIEEPKDLWRGTAFNVDHLKGEPILKTVTFI